MSFKAKSSRNKSHRYSAGERVTTDCSLDASHKRVWYKKSIAGWYKNPTPSNGFLGPTSYLDIFSETHSDSMGAKLQISTANRTSLDSNTAYDPEDFQLGAQILLLLEYMPFYEKIIQFRIDMSEGWIIGPPFLRELLVILREKYHDVTEGSDDKHSSLLRWSEALFENAASPTSIDKGMTFLSYIAGVSCRWETLGFLFALIGSAVFQIPQPESIFQQKNFPGKDIVEFRKSMTSASDICLRFCDSTGTMSDALCWAVLQQTVLFSHMYGCRGRSFGPGKRGWILADDIADYRTWRRLGDLATMVYALGFHQPDNDSCLPFFLAEIRVRTMVGAYTLDKELATFLGRPPLICWDYCNIRYPLDINYDELVADIDERTTALQGLDAHGWNTEGSTKKGARARTTLLLGILLEKILKLSLCRQGDDLEQKAE